MKLLSKVSLFLFAIVALSCESKDKEVEKLKSETIAIHDEVMPKMDDIMELKRSLKAELDSASYEDSTNIQRLIFSLEASDKAMMNWMRNYDPQLKNMSDDEKIAYLKNQKASIQKVSDQMKESISNAGTYLEE